MPEIVKDYGDQQEFISSSENPFLQFEKPYEITMERERGEKYLALIARNADQEYTWAYDQATSIWYYHPPESHHELVNREEESVEFRTVIPDALLSPHSPESSIYHIHPNLAIEKLFEKPQESWKNDKEYFLLTQMVPSTLDIEATIAMTRNGYEDFRIITPKGITILRFHPDKLTKQKTTLHGITIPKKELTKRLEKGGLEVLQHLFKKFNNHYKGIITFEFKLY